MVEPRGSTEDDVVVVPNLVGLLVPVARHLGVEIGVVVASTDPDGSPLAELTWPGTWLVSGQTPSPGSFVRRGTFVRITVEEEPGGGGAGVREPLRPAPDPGHLVAAHEEEAFDS